jgi:predicted nucleic acid-binding protein
MSRAVTTIIFTARRSIDPAFRRHECLVRAGRRAGARSRAGSCGETVTLVRKRRGWERARRLGAELRAGRAAALVHVAPADLDAAWALFERRPDQRLSFTDCTSFVLMERLKLAAAVTLDQDFRALGLATLP